MTADPPVRADGLCAQCGGPRQMPKRSPHSSIALEEYALDPFCSQGCCREWHDVPAPRGIYGNPDEKRGRHARTRKVAA